jgi:hypothetical protein
MTRSIWILLILCSTLLARADEPKAECKAPIKEIALGDETGELSVFTSYFMAPSWGHSGVMVKPTAGDDGKVFTAFGGYGEAGTQRARERIAAWKRKDLPWTKIFSAEGRAKLKKNFLFNIAGRKPMYKYVLKSTPEQRRAVDQYITDRIGVCARQTCTSGSYWALMKAAGIYMPVPFRWSPTLSTLYLEAAYRMGYLVQRKETIGSPGAGPFIAATSEILYPSLAAALAYGGLKGISLGVNYLWPGDDDKDKKTEEVTIGETYTVDPAAH